MSITLELPTLILLVSLILSLGLTSILYVKLILRDIERMRAGRAVIEEHTKIHVPARPALVSGHQASHQEEPQASPTISRTFSTSVVSRHPGQVASGREVEQRSPAATNGTRTTVAHARSESVVSSMSVAIMDAPTRPTPVAGPSKPRSSAQEFERPVPSISYALRAMHRSTAAVSSSTSSVQPSQSTSLGSMLSLSSSRSVSPLSPLTTPPGSPAPMTPMSSPQTALSSVTTHYEDDEDTGKYEYKRTTKAQSGRLRESEGKAEVPAVAYFKSKGAALLDGPPDSSACQNLQVGDVFCHTADSFSPPRYQLWLRDAKADGGTYWKVVYTGYERRDKKRLILTHSKKNPSWVTDGHYKRWLREEQKLVEEEQAKGNMDARIPGSRKL
ncbi:hypothetical protein BN946_scf185010.g8 [Trametes cinnabarina]|uniref:Uncharacterized protein n=1 Tax=Pycnoporus cinnabarinus TaxID=5643 RepID=A0A060SRJ2_PYCCI|nr:hypothetical protein BN946_scf185010.g8 [Trametes cinnabarina]